MALMVRALLALIVAGLLAGCGSVVPPNPNPTPLPMIWPNSETTFATQDHDHPHLHDGKCVVDKALLLLIAEAGFTAVRMDNVLVPWETPKNKDGSYDIDCIITEYLDAVEFGLTPLLTEASPRKAPYTDDDAAAIPPFLTQVAAQTGWAIFELGNEPDIPQYWPTPQTPDTYWASYGKPWTDAIRKGNPVAFIGTGGTQSIAIAWNKQLIADITRDGYFESGAISAIGVHLYGESLQPNPQAGYTGQQGLAHLVTDLQSLKAIVPNGVTVWATEYGVPNPQPADVAGAPAGAAPQLQSQPGLLPAVRAVGLPFFSYYESRDNCTYGEQVGFACEPSWSLAPWGLLNIDNTPKPAYYAAQHYLAPTPPPSPPPSASPTP